MRVNALEPTANSVRCAPAVGGGSPRALGRDRGDFVAAPGFC